MNFFKFLLFDGGERGRTTTAFIILKSRPLLCYFNKFICIRLVGGCLKFKQYKFLF